MMFGFMLIQDIQKLKILITYGAIIFILLNDVNFSLMSVSVSDLAKCTATSMDANIWFFIRMGPEMVVEFVEAFEDACAELIFTNIKH